MVLSFGNTTLRKQYVPDSEVDSLSEGGFLLRAVNTGDVTVIADGKDIGVSYGSYEVLLQMGFSFLHPLEPTMPSICNIVFRNDTQNPYWPVRGWHIHTEHPLELTDFLQGFDITINGTVSETWDSMMGDWIKFLDWAVANKISQA